MHATKGLINTSTYLTRDALALIEREKTRLAEVERNDLVTGSPSHAFAGVTAPILSALRELNRLVSVGKLQ